MGTADLALLVLALVAGAAALVLGGGLPRLTGRWSRWRHERLILREQLRQERLRTAVLEEQLRNEILRDLHPRRTPEE